MDPFDELDPREIRRLIVDEVVDFGNEDIQPISSFDHENETDDASLENHYENPDHIMEDEDQSEALIDRYEESNTIVFKEMFRNAAIYPSAYSIFKSEKLDWGLTIFFLIFKYFQANATFPDNQRNLNSPFKKLRSEYVGYIIKKLKKKMILSLKKLQTYLIVGLI